MLAPFSSASLPLLPFPWTLQERWAPAALGFCGCMPYSTLLSPESGSAPKCPYPLTSPDCPKQEGQLSHLGGSWELLLGAPGHRPTCHKNSLVLGPDFSVHLGV